MGLAPDHVDHSRPDVGADEEEEENFGTSGFRQPDPAGHGTPEHAHHGLKRQTEMGSTEGTAGSSGRRRLRSADEHTARPRDTLTEEAAESFKVFDEATATATRTRNPRVD